MRFAPLVFAGALCAALIAPAAAQEVSDEVDFHLWCGSAFHLLGVFSDDEAEAASFIAAGEHLTDLGAMMLFDAEMSEDEVIAIIEAYDDQVVADFDSPDDLPYAAEDCLSTLETLQP